MSDPLARFDPPARIDDFRRSRSKRRRFRRLWHEAVDRLMEDEVRNSGPDFYNPRTTRIGNAPSVKVEWTAFPKPSEDASIPLADKLRRAETRTQQFEYCEWCVKRHGTSGEVLRVTFTSESVEYWQTLWAVDPQRVLALYRRLVSRSVQLADLRDAGGGYKPLNIWNIGSEYRPDGGGAVHMVVGINTISAAVPVVGGAADRPTDLPGGGPYHADQLINLTVSRVVGRLRQRISFSDPVGVYLQEPDFNRFELPATAPRDVSASDFWTVVRGRRSHGQALHAVYRVPRGLGFSVGDIRIDGRPIEYGSQIARTLKSGTFVTPIPRP